MRLSTALGALLLCLLIQTAWALDVRLGDTVVPLRQSVTLEVDPTRDDFRGRSALALRVKEAAPAVRLHALDITIDKALLTGPEGSRELVPEAGDEGLVSLKSAGPIEPGDYVLDLEFSGPFNRNSSGLYKYFDQDRPYLSTQFEMTDARRAFPCFDEPIFKIPYQLTIIAPKDHRVFSNTPEVQRLERGDRVVHRFHETPPMPSYLVALAVGPYESTDLEGLGVPGRLVTTQGKLALTDYARQVTPTLLKSLENYFGVDYPYQKLDQIAVTEFPYGAMENAGMIAYREDILLINPATAQLSDRAVSTAVIAHELAHQWFGNLVTMKWWNDLWLNEAFATWMADKIVRQEFPDLELHLETIQNQVMGGDARLSSKPIRKPIRTEADILDGLSLAYRKGGSALSMVERWIGEDTFRDGMRTYMERHRFGNASAGDLWSILSEVSGKDVQAVLTSFTEQPGYPLITLKSEGRTLRVHQQRYTNAGVEADPQTWSVPLFLRYGKGDRVATHSVLLDQTRAEVELEFEPDWVLPDDGGIGYFRWNVPPDWMSTLVQGDVKLTDREKLATIHNINGLFHAGVLSAGESLESVSEFADDDQLEVLRLVLRIVERYGDLYVHDENRPQWQAFLARRLEPLIARYGLDAKEGEHPRTPSLRSKLISLMGLELEDETIRERARAVTSSYLNGEEVDPSTVEAYLTVAAYEAEPALVDEVHAALQQAKDPQRRSTLLATLGRFGQPQTQAKAMDLMLDESITPSDLRTLLGLNADLRDTRRQRLQQWLEANYKPLSEKMPDAFLAYIPLSLSSARDEESLRAILDFYGKQEDPRGALARALVKLEESVRTAIATRERGQASFDQFLRQ